MTLHDAMRAILRDAGGPLSPKAIAELISRQRLYRKKDGPKLTPSQVSARARTSERLFLAVEGRIELVAHERGESSGSILSCGPEQTGGGTWDLTAFHPAGEVHELVPSAPGIYAIRLRDVGSLPEPFRDLAEHRGHGLLYIGQASGSLRRRLLEQELRSRGHGTFFRSLGAVLGYRPSPGSLLGKRNTRNYTFTPQDRQEIADWIDAHLLIAWEEGAADLDARERALIRHHLPLLNIRDNPAALPELIAVREECRRIAVSAHSVR